MWGGGFSEGVVTGVTWAGEAGDMCVRGWSGVFLVGVIALWLCGPDDDLQVGWNMFY